MESVGLVPFLMTTCLQVEKYRPSRLHSQPPRGNTCRLLGTTRAASEGCKTGQDGIETGSCLMRRVPPYFVSSKPTRAPLALLASLLTAWTAAVLLTLPSF